jgi:hypothetical protein
MTSARDISLMAVTDSLSGQMCFGDEGVFYGHPNICTSSGINDIECDPRLVSHNNHMSTL